MKYYLTIVIILLIISTVAADSESTQFGLDRRTSEIIKPINITNTTINITEPINITDNITDLINITDNTTIIIIPINLTNFTELNITRNETINITINETINITINETINQTNTTIKPEEIILSPPIQEDFTTYFYAGNRLIATKNNENIKYHYQDHLGSDINSKSLPFGQPLDIQNRFSFSGKEFDLGEYYFGARYYDPNLGRFTSVDPIKTEPPYQYVRNNPLRFIDPDGRETKEKYQNLILFSEAMKVTQTPLILNFPTQQDVDNYRTTVVDSLISTNQKNILIDLENGIPISIPGYGESTKLPLFGTNSINTLFQMEVSKNGPIENVIFFMHSATNTPGNIVLEMPGTLPSTSEPKIELTNSLLSLPDEYLAPNGQIIFAICHTDTCINGQAIADSLGVTVYVSPNEVEFVEGISPPLIYGQFNEYKPKKED